MHLMWMVYSVAFKPNVLAGRFFNQIGGAIGTAGEYSNGAAGPVNPGIVGDMEVYSIQTAHEANYCKY